MLVTRHVTVCWHVSVANCPAKREERGCAVSGVLVNAVHVHGLRYLSAAECLEEGKAAAMLLLLLMHAVASGVC
jgi:hypothetical protein